MSGYVAGALGRLDYMYIAGVYVSKSKSVWEKGQGARYVGARWAAASVRQSHVHPAAVRYATTSA